MQQRFDLDLRLVFHPLHPETPQEGAALEDLFAGRVNIDRMHVKMRYEAEQVGLPYGERSHTYNSRLAQELGKWADWQPNGAALHDAIYRAYFADGANISDPEVLVGLAAGVGLDADAARSVLEQRSFSPAVDADWAKARNYGVTGVPTFVAGGMAVVGAQPLELLERFIVHAQERVAELQGAGQSDG